MPNLGLLGRVMMSTNPGNNLSKSLLGSSILTKPLITDVPPIKMKDIVDKTLKLKVKWQKLRILLKAVTSFHGPEGTSTARSMSDPELGNAIREEEADIEQHKCIMADP